MYYNETITIIVPVYNVKWYIQRCIDSIIKQTYSNLQIVIVDDGSTDGSGELCDKYKMEDARVDVIHTANSGLSAARNEGMKHVIGDHVIFVDSDDFIGPRHVELLYEALQSSCDPANSIAVTGWTEVKTSDGAKEIAQYDTARTERLSRSEAINTSVVFGERFAAHAWGKLYPRAFYDLLEYPVGRYYEDQYVTYKVFLEAAEVLYVSSNDYFYTIDRYASISNGKRLRRLDSLDALREMLLCVQERCPESEPHVRTRYQIALIGCVDDTYIANDAKTYQILCNEALCEKATAESNPLLPVATKLRYRSLSVQSFREALLRLYASASGIKDLRIPKKLHAKTKELVSGPDVYRRYCKLSEGVSGPIAYLIMTPRYRNYGDQLIAFSELTLLNEAGISHIIEIPFEDCQILGPRLADLLKSGDCVFVTGGGYLGDLWVGLEKTLLKAISRIGPGNPIIFFPQSVFYYRRDIIGSPFARAISASKAPIVIFAREERTYASLRRALPAASVSLMPDAGLFVKRDSLMDEAPPRKTNDALLCLRSDKEGVRGRAFGLRLSAALQNAGYSMHAIDTHDPNGELETEARHRSLANLAREFGQASVVVTDRLHGMVLAMIMGTPCIVLDNVSKKVSGVAAWVKDEYPLVVSDPDEIEDAINRISECRSFKGDVSVLLGKEKKALLGFIAEVIHLG